LVDRRQRDKRKTRKDVLEAATRLFSQKGLHGTSLRDIERASGVSKGLILHHFETKENLYAAVQDHLNQIYIDWMATRRDASRDLRAAIETGIGGSLDYLLSNPEYRRIGLWAYLEGQERTMELDKRFTASLIETMRSGQEIGLVREDVNAFVLPFVIRGAIDNWIRRESLRGELNEAIPGEGEITDVQFVDALVQLILV
jgi:TetR/AcrR family transcriptional regulator